MVFFLSFLCLQAYPGLFIRFYPFSCFIRITIWWYEQPCCREYKFMSTTFPMYKVVTVYLMLAPTWFMREGTIPLFLTSTSQLLATCLPWRSSWGIMCRMEVHGERRLSSVSPDSFRLWRPLPQPKCLPIPSILPPFLPWNFRNIFSLSNQEWDNVCCK